VKEVNRRIASVAFAVILVATLAAPLTLTAQAKNPTETDMGDYTEYVGALGGANFVVRIPNEGWNGMLVVGCHGYRMNWTPDDQFAVDGLINGDGIGLPFALIEQGFAYAASSYGEGGWCIQKAMIRTHQLTEYVIGKFGVTGKVFLIGHSMGGTIVLLLGEKYPELYDGVLDSCGMKDVVQAYIGNVALINSPVFPTLPPPVQMFMLQAVSDWEAEFGGSYDDKPKAYEKKNPISNAEISVPTVSVHGAQDPLSSLYQQTVYGMAVAAAGCSEYYRAFTVDPGMHGDPPVIDEVLVRIWDLVDYPTGW